jgi:hypothetical protein
MAHKSGMNFAGKPMTFHLEDEYGPIPPELLYVPHYKKRCDTCGSRLICNGCADCGKCTE